MAGILRITTKIDTQDENYLTALAALLLRVSPGSTSLIPQCKQAVSIRVLADEYRTHCSPELILTARNDGVMTQVSWKSGLCQ